MLIEDGLHAINNLAIAVVVISIIPFDIAIAFEVTFANTLSSQDSSFLTLYFFVFNIFYLFNFYR